MNNMLGHLMKLLVFICLLIFNVFQVHAIEPQKIIEEWQSCQLKTILDKKCATIGHQALELRDMIEALEINPQLFGVKIMELQNKLNSSDLNQLERKNLQQELDYRLAVVGWLESPK